MKHTHIALVLCFMLTSVAGFAQTKGYTSNIGFQGSFLSSSCEPKVVSWELNAAPGYNFNKRFTVRVPFEAAVHLFDYDDKRDYQLASVLGLGVGYNVIANGTDILEIGVSAGNTLGGNDWQYMCFDGGVKWAVGSNSHRYYVGVGVKYYKSERANTDNLCNGYATIGFRFN